MIFRPELAEKVIAGDKTVTRRAMSSNLRSPWWRYGCGLAPGITYAVQLGRGVRSIGRVRVVDVRRSVLGDVDDEEAAREGFSSCAEFVEAWRSIYGGWDPHEVVWRVEFRSLVDPVSGRERGEAA